MTRSFKTMAGALALSLCACEYSATPAEGGLPAAAAADADAVKSLETRFLTAWEAKDPAVKDLYAADAVLMMPEMQPMQGARPIAESFDRFASDPAATFDAANATTVISAGGDLAYSQGTYTMRFTNPATKAVEEGKGYYLLVHKKQPDGSWKVVQDVSSPLP